MKRVTLLLFCTLTSYGQSPRQLGNPPGKAMLIGPNTNRVDYVMASRTVGTVVTRWHGTTWVSNVFSFVDITNRPTAPKTQMVISWTSPVMLLASSDLSTWTRMPATAATAVAIPRAAPTQFFKVPLPNQSVLLSWDASPPEVTGFRVYWGTNSSIYPHSADAGFNTNYTVAALLPGSVYYFAATAYNNDGLESVFSDEVSYAVPVVEILPKIETVP